MYTVTFYLRNLFSKRHTASMKRKKYAICSRFYVLDSTTIIMVSKPSLKDLKSRKYLKKSQSGYTHSREWENSKSTMVVSLRLDERFFTYLDKQKASKRRTSNRVVGETPDDSYVQRGRRASKYSHQLRKELSRLLTMEIDTLVVWLYQNPDYKPGKKRKHSIRLPDLSLAMQELIEELALRDERLLEHPALRRMHLPAMCRLLEIRSMYQTGDDWTSDV